MDQHLELQSLGILRQVTTPPELSWMSDAEKGLIFDIFIAGEAGLHKRTVAKVEKAHEGIVLELEVRGLIEWQSDKAGRPVSMVLTWKGQDVAQLLAQIARNESQRPAYSGNKGA